MTRSKTSKKWLREHFDDEYVKKAKAAGFRSRASYKLLEIDEKEKLFKPGLFVVDLGAAPGGWSQIAVRRVGETGCVVALDILAMEKIEGVHFIQGDFRQVSVLAQLMDHIGQHKIDLVISDMAPNMSGNKSIDIPRAMYLFELVFDFANKVLVSDGVLLSKIFHGAGFDEILQQARTNFKKVVIRKPKASRDRSKESYLLAKGFKV